MTREQELRKQLEEILREKRQLKGRLDRELFSLSLVTGQYPGEPDSYLKTFSLSPENAHELLFEMWDEFPIYDLNEPDSSRDAEYSKKVLKRWQKWRGGVSSQVASNGDRT